MEEIYEVFNRGGNEVYTHTNLTYVFDKSALGTKLTQNLSMNLFIK